MAATHKVPPLRVTVDVLFFVLLGLSLLAFQIWARPVKKGFYCDDDTIRYPYRPDTVSRGLAGVLGLGVGALLIIVFEVLRIFYENRNVPKSHFDEYYICGKKTHRIFVRLYVFLGYFAIGAMMTIFMTEVAKYTTGRLRPHFIAVCKPDVACAAENSASTLHVYHTNYTCLWEKPEVNAALTRDEKHQMHDARQSFPSGHSSFTFYAMMYVILYLHARVWWPLIGVVVVPVLQMACASIAIFVGLSRITDFKHHWSDVLAGALLGSFVAIFVAALVAELWSRREMPANYDLREFNPRLIRPPMELNDGQQMGTLVGTSYPPSEPQAAIVQQYAGHRPYHPSHQPQAAAPLPPLHVYRNTQIHYNA